MGFKHRAQRSFISVAAGALVLSVLPAAAAVADRDAVCEGAPDAGFSDAAADGAHTTPINCMHAYGIGQGRTDGSYGVFTALSRGQASSLFVQFATTATGGQIVAEVDDDVAVPFDDIAGTTHEDNIEILFRLGLIAGTSPTTFSPNDPINRGQFATILRNAHVELGVPFTEGLDAQFDDVAGTTHEEAINQLADAGIISGRVGGGYGPGEVVSRGATATLLAASAGALDTLDLWTADRLVEPSPGDDDEIEAPTTVLSVTSSDVGVERASAVFGEGNNDEVTVTAAQAGFAGNDLNIVVRDDGSGTESGATAVVEGTTITVEYGDGITTAQQVAEALDAIDLISAEATADNPGVMNAIETKPLVGGSERSVIVVGFNQAMDPDGAQDVANYSLPDTSVGIATATLSGSDQVVTLRTVPSDAPGDLVGNGDQLVITSTDGDVSTVVDTAGAALENPIVPILVG